MTEECNCPAPGVETSSTELCEVITDNDCLEYCEIDPDDINEEWIPVCTDCLVNDDSDDAVEAYEECFGCLDNCDDEDAPTDCIGYCNFLYCVGPYETCTTDPDNMFCAIDCTGLEGGDDYSCFDDASQDDDDEDDSDDGAETCDECLEDCDYREEPWEVDSCIDFCNETICW